MGQIGIDYGCELYRSDQIESDLIGFVFDWFGFGQCDMNPNRIGFVHFGTGLDPIRLNDTQIDAHFHPLFCCCYDVCIHIT